MSQSPLPHSFAIFGSAEVVLVLRPAHPPPLAGGLRSPATIRLSTKVLPPAITGIAAVLFVAMQALEGGFGTHRRVENKPPQTPLHAPCVEENPASATLKKNREEDAGRRVLSEALEEDTPLTPPDVHPADSIGLPERCPQMMASLQMLGEFATKYLAILTSGPTFRGRSDILGAITPWISPQ